MSEFSFCDRDPWMTFLRIYHLGYKITLFVITKAIFQPDLVNERMPPLPGCKLASLGPFVGCDVVHVEPDIDDLPRVAYTAPDFSILFLNDPWTWPVNR